MYVRIDENLNRLSKPVIHVIDVQFFSPDEKVVRFEHFFNFFLSPVAMQGDFSWPPM